MVAFRQVAVAVVVTLVPALALADEPTAPEATSAGEGESVRVAATIPSYTVGGPGTTAAVEPVAETPAAPAAPTGLARRRAEDPAAGRAYFSETALTTPRGRVTLDLRAPTAPLAATGVRVGVTDRLELGAHGVVVADEGGAAGVSLKAQLWRNERLAFAAGVNTISADGETVVDLHAEATGCIDAACVATVTGALNLLAISGEDEVPVFGGVGLALGRSAQFIAELHQTRMENDSLTLGYVGARFGSPRLSIDGGLAFGVADESSSCDGCVDEGSDGLVFPFVGLATRL